MGRPYVCEDCGTPGVQAGGGKAQKRCDRCRAGTGGNTPRKGPTKPAARTTPPTAPATGQKPARQFSTIAAAVVADLDALMTPHPMADGLRELALALAARVDDCEEKHVAALSRELRATLDSLASFQGGGDDGADGEIDLSAEVLDPP